MWCCGVSSALFLVLALCKAKCLLEIAWIGGSIEIGCFGYKGVRVHGKAVWLGSCVHHDTLDGGSGSMLRQMEAMLFRAVSTWAMPLLVTVM